MKKKISIFWFRRDLRLKDQVGLSYALRGAYPVLPIFIFDLHILQELERNDARVNFIHENLIKIHQELNTHGSALEVHSGYPYDIWLQLIDKYDVQEVYTNKDYEPYSISRDEQIAQLLLENNISFHQYKDQVIFEENEILKLDQTPYTVFTPYSKKWKSVFHLEFSGAIEMPSFDAFFKFHHDIPSLSALGFEKSSLQIKDYTLNHLDQYSEIRDFPSLDATTYLSVHLRFGTVGIREIIGQINARQEIFLNELIWREFFMQIIYHFPRVIHENFRSKYNGIEWRNNEADFKNWCQGTTGYPMVDAGMRQLNSTGYLHNRVRMVCAGFLCKHLLIDWRWGESYFAQKLLDYELSSNNGNWQWAAGTGCDAAPYFRIFNPMEQLRKFDQKLEYIRKWIEDFDSIHYPSPMVDHKTSRERALRAYKKGVGMYENNERF